MLCIIIYVCLYDQLWIFYTCHKFVIINSKLSGTAFVNSKGAVVQLPLAGASTSVLGYDVKLLPAVLHLLSLLCRSLRRSLAPLMY